MDASNAAAVPIEVQVLGVHDPNIAGHAEEVVRRALRGARGPVLHARVRITRHADPAVDRPVIAEANVDVDGRLVRAQVAAATAAEAADLLHDRLRERVQRDRRRHGGHWEDRRGRQPAPEPHEWRHGNQPTHRPPYYPRPAEEREIVRHKSFTPARSDVDEAVAEMDDLDHDFHLFTEEGSGQDSLLYRAGPTGLRLAQVEPHPDEIARHTVPLTVSAQPAPVLSTTEAVQRMAVQDLPFLFFLDGERGCGAVLYHRYDGHYGLITPVAPAA
jgi:Sigma 54 modulation/S30EA ribosomal protein C terminus